MGYGAYTEGVVMVLCSDQPMEMPSRKFMVVIEASQSPWP